MPDTSHKVRNVRMNTYMAPRVAYTAELVENARYKLK